MADVHIKVTKRSAPEDDEDMPKNPFAGILGGDEGDDEGEGDEEGDYAVSPEEVEAAKGVRSAIDGGSDEDLAKALCQLMELHSTGKEPSLKKLMAG